MLALIDAHSAKLSATEFFAMVESGAFGDRRVFLWDGRLREKMARTNAHAFVAMRIGKALAAILPPGWDIWQENPSTWAAGTSRSRTWRSSEARTSDTGMPGPALSTRASSSRSP